MNAELVGVVLLGLGYLGLLFGCGMAVERGWVFILLARQQGLDAAMLALADTESPLKAPQPWAVGVLHEGQVYLFDPVLGLPVPAQDGIVLGDDGQLAIRPATLAQAADWVRMAPTITSKGVSPGHQCCGP